MSFDEKWNQRVAFQCSCCFTNYTFVQWNNLRSVWLDKDEKYGKTTVCGTCGKLFHQGKWQIKSYKDIFVIYTTHLEMPQVSPNFLEDTMNSRYFWETMIQNTQTEEFLDFQARYNNCEDAIEGHWLAYDKLEDMILNPEKYPVGIIPMFKNAIDAVVSQKKNHTVSIQRLGAHDGATLAYLWIVGIFLCKRATHHF